MQIGNFKQCDCEPCKKNFLKTSAMGLVAVLLIWGWYIHNLGSIEQNQALVNECNSKINEANKKLGIYNNDPGFFNSTYVTWNESKYNVKGG